MSIDDTRSAYDQDADREWDRPESGAQHRLEFLVTLHALARHLPQANSSVRVLDAGGGPGRYTMALAEQGYRVSLLDLSPRLLDIARARTADLPAPAQDRIEAVVEGSITDLALEPNSLTTSANGQTTEEVRAMTPAEKELQTVERAKRDPRAFAPLYDTYADIIWRFAMSRLGDPERARDVTSQTFVHSGRLSLTS